MSKSFALGMLSLVLPFNVEFVLAERVKPFVKTEFNLHNVGMSGFVVNAKETLEGQSIRVFRVSNEALKGAGMKYESQPIIRTFSATHVTDEINGEKSSDPVTYRDNYWCRFDVFS